MKAILWVRGVFDGPGYVEEVLVDGPSDINATNRWRKLYTWIENGWKIVDAKASCRTNTDIVILEKPDAPGAPEVQS